MKVFPSFLQLHGKTYDYKIPYTSVLRLFLLPHKDGRFMFFVVSVALTSSLMISQHFKIWKWIYRFRQMVWTCTVYKEMDALREHKC